jgi:uncharacterized protein (TIGR02246 family)
MTIARFAIALAAFLFAAAGARAETGPRDEVLALYGRFAAAQNARDLAAVRALMIDSPDFLWVSDGKSVWGPDDVIARMSGFQRLEIWRVEPLLDKARVVPVAPQAAFLHLPLDLHLGSRAEPSVTRFLVSMLCRRTDGGWRIAALFTTLDNP